MDRGKALVIAKGAYIEIKKAIDLINGGCFAGEGGEVHYPTQVQVDGWIFSELECEDVWECDFCEGVCKCMLRQKNPDRK